MLLVKVSLPSSGCRILGTAGGVLLVKVSLPSSGCRILGTMRGDDISSAFQTVPDINEKVTDEQLKIFPVQQKR